MQVPWSASPRSYTHRTRRPPNTTLDSTFYTPTLPGTSMVVPWQCVVPVVRLGLRSSTKAKEKEMGRRQIMPTLKRNSPCSILALRGVVRKGTESASSLWLLSVACCSIIKHSHDSNRAISCERGVAIVANCAYPLRYLASRFSSVPRRF